MASFPVQPGHDEVNDADWARRLFASLASEPREVVSFAYFDPEWRYLGMRHSAGERGAADVSIREIMRDVLSLEARLVLMAHNHPGGSSSASQDDLAVTAKLARTLDAIGVTLVDHLILGADGFTSLRGEGYL
ncbi:JAB domain-containing protein [Sphingomonas sp.]|jgi:DNA repair protein RadC|uniref:JAB domain-containing protein n=1 Tax=Sphingomonas sp. TaxID=28214 RepID=UPI002E33DC1E|nr:JAB domain-containing protein [Sphingomonas sp.]HEX4695579.1 JAB domain-containing protein [Sphingomonas sp.]